MKKTLRAKPNSTNPNEEEKEEKLEEPYFLAFFFEEQERQDSRNSLAIPPKNTSTIVENNPALVKVTGAFRNCSCENAQIIHSNDISLDQIFQQANKDGNFDYFFG